MLKPLIGFDQEIALWVGKRTEIVDFGPCRSIGIIDGETIIAGVVYSNMRRENIEATIAADHPRWCRREILRTLFAYPFIQLGCRRMTCIIEVRNERSTKLCTGLGFKIEGHCREVFGPADGIVLGMLARECKWIR